MSASRAAKQIADHAKARGVTFVNHTFTSHLALSASLQPYAGLEDHDIAEYPFAPRSLGASVVLLGIVNYLLASRLFTPIGRFLNGEARFEDAQRRITQLPIRKVCRSVAVFFLLAIVVTPCRCFAFVCGTAPQRQDSYLAGGET